MKSSKLKIAALLAEGLNVQQIATLTGRSKRTIERRKAEIRAAIQPDPDAKSEYARLIEKSVTLPERAALYRELATSAGVFDKNPIVRLKTLERLDDLSGVVTEKDKIRAPKEQPATEHQPMFVVNNAQILMSMAEDPQGNTPEKTKLPAYSSSEDPIR